MTDLTLKTKIKPDRVYDIHWLSAGHLLALYHSLDYSISNKGTVVQKELYKFIKGELQNMNLLV